MNSAKENSEVVKAIWPETWIVPDAPVPKSAFRSPLLFKPNGGSQGDGIVVILKRADLQRRLDTTHAEGGSGVVQRFLRQPMLLDGLKFDLRLYVCLLQHDPMQPIRAFLLQDGLVRCSTRPYEEPHSGNLYKTDALLTNYSLSKYDHKFVHNEDPGEFAINECPYCN